MTAVDEIREIFEGSGGRQYGGERVTQLAHALQCAAAAEAAGASAPLIVAALLHDVGRLLHDLGPRPAERGIDDRHEERGALWLAQRFGSEVAELVRLHVNAKRYLCAIEPQYFHGRSPGSVRSLALQGGPFDAAGAADFIGAPHAEDAVRLRRWDEAAKVAGLATPGLAHFADRLRACQRS